MATQNKVRFWKKQLCSCWGFLLWPLRYVLQNSKCQSELLLFAEHALEGTDELELEA